jgi:putative transposase
MEYAKNANAVYLLTYHIVFVTKCRKPVITDGIGDFMKELSASICADHGGKLLSAETDTDHIHLLVSMPPQEKPSDLVRVLKTQLSKKTHAREEFNQTVKEHLYGDAQLWSPSYFIATAGGVTGETVKAYVQSQRTDAHKRKYEKTGKYKKRG